MLLAPQLGLLDVLYIESDFFAKLKEWPSHVLSDIVDEVSNDNQVDHCGEDHVRHPKSKHSDKQMTLHLVKFFKFCILVQNEELVGTLRLKIIDLSELYIAKDEKRSLHFTIFCFISGSTFIQKQFCVILSISPVLYFEFSNVYI